MKCTNQLNPTPVRLPPELKVWLQHSAIDSHRSLSSEIVVRLEQSRKLEEGAKQ